MDRKGKQKISYILWALAAVISVMVFTYCFIHYEAKYRENQKQELVTIYPEIESELQNNFSYYQDHVIRLELIAMVVMTFMILCMGCSLIWIEGRKRRFALTEYDKELDLIYEQLQSFHKGDFELLPSLKERTAAGKLDRVHEKLRELGYFFSDLKLRLMEEENNTKSLITDISHQLKTPLASIRMCHELAKSADLSEEEQNEFLTTEAMEIIKLEALLDELVKLSRLESNMIQIKPEKNSLRQTISEAVSQIFMKAHAKSIEISVDMEEDATISHDKKWTVEALANILENAVKYSEPMTEVSIRVSNLPNSVILEIEDEGIGIQEEELHNIFKRFYRGSRARKITNEGAGIGLYLSRSIIEQQGGTVIAKRKSGHGTIFKITFPL